MNRKAGVGKGEVNFGADNIERTNERMNRPGYYVMEVLLLIFRRDRPLIVQGDRTVLLEVNHPSFQRVRDYLSGFADLVKLPDLPTPTGLPLFPCGMLLHPVQTPVRSSLFWRKKANSVCQPP